MPRAPGTPKLDLHRLSWHAHYARTLGPWLRDRLDLREARAMIQRGLQTREQELLHTLKHGVYGQPDSPYLALLRHAGAEYEDVARAVIDKGVEPALAQLYDAGVRITLDELKTRVPITRPGLELHVNADAFTNPLIRADLHLTSGGTRGKPHPTLIDFRLLERDAAHMRLFQEATGILGRPIAAWRPSLPAGPGINHHLIHGKLGQRMERWFTQLSAWPPHESPRSGALLAATLAISRASGVPFPFPRHVPLDHAVTVARWLNGHVERGRPPFLNTTASGAVRVCEAAKAAGLDIEGAVFRVGGEPFTPARARVISEAGCTAYPFLQANEVGRIGVTCAARKHPDELHFLSDKLAVLRRDVDARTRRVEGSLVLTTLWGRAPKLLLNVESDDTAVVETGPCGCPLGELGLTTRIHTVRSWEKLTTEGMTFTSSYTLRLVEEVLPERFGGGPTDYQLVEDRSGPLSKIRLLVSPRVGPADATAVREAALEELGADGPSGRFMAESWRAAGLPEVERREPYATRRPKILPLHVIDG
ncbi:MAG TPA: hypothetical protein VF587_15980 [Solirubrobacteraceae bacterium]